MICPTLGNRIDEIAKGQKIWVGSDNFDWDMLRVDETNIVTSNHAQQMVS